MLSKQWWQDVLSRSSIDFADASVAEVISFQVDAIGKESSGRRLTLRVGALGREVSISPSSLAAPGSEGARCVSPHCPKDQITFAHA